MRDKGLRAYLRFDTAIGNPPSGWVVSFWTGHGFVSAMMSNR